MPVLKRVFPSFIEAFKEFCAGKDSPDVFVEWAALWCISAAVERKCKVYTDKGPLWPNIFVMLFAPPAAGKSLVIDEARDLVKSLGTNRLTASSISAASLADHLRLGQRTLIDPKTQAGETFFATNIVSTDMQVLFKEYDIDILGKMTNVYDCKEYSESRRGGEGKNTFEMDRTYVTMLAGTNPTHLFSTFPENAWGTGFMSRTIIVYGTQNPDTPSFFTLTDQGEEGYLRIERMKGELVKDLASIGQVQGIFKWEPEARDLWDTFARTPGKQGGKPIPAHPRLLHYNSRRAAHLLKLMMGYALDRDDKLFMTVGDYEKAYEFLVATEINMPFIFQQSAGGGEAQLASDVHHTALVAWQKNGSKPIPLAKLVTAISGKLPSYQHKSFLDMLINGGWFREVDRDPLFGRMVVPEMDSPFSTERKSLRPEGD